MHFAMTIGGAAVRDAARFDVVNPATEQPFATAPACTADQLDEAMHAASAAQCSWARDPDSRRDALLRLAAIVSDKQEHLAALLTSEQGKPTREAILEVGTAAAWITYFGSQDIEPVVLRDDNARVVVSQRPVGVVAAITPWNFPILLATWKLAPALLAGNTIVIKPSPYTPLTTLDFGRLAQEVLPPGVLNVITGDGDLGRQVVEHPVPTKITFTGSIPTGRKIAAAAAMQLKRTTLELGGNDPALLLDDVDVDAIAGRLFWSAFANNGQICSAVKRIYVPSSLHSTLVESLSAIALSANLGDGTDPTTHLGPLTNETQRQHVERLVDAARHAGRTIVCGGKRPERRGYFFEPTVVAGATEADPLVAEEQFGPALPVLPYDDVDVAITEINAGPFGLAASVWSSDEERAATFADRIDCGTAWINTHLALAPDQPFGGVKASGIGRENGTWGLDEFTEVRVTHVAHDDSQTTARKEDS